MKKPFCVAPYIEGFSADDAPFRNCCAADPQIKSLPSQSFAEWWADPRLIQFRKDVEHGWHPSCMLCKHQEDSSGSSFRLALNESVTEIYNWPQRWNLKFSNICNLGCWSCNEYSSSVIAQHKKLTNQLSSNFEDPNIKFYKLWENLESDVLKSYEYYEIVTLTILGGEPLYNKTVIDFLQKLINLGLSTRTRLEFHTNGTKINNRLLEPTKWNYICMFLSIDAVGKKAEWLRYGSNWGEINTNVDFFKSVANYIEVHCVLSILNISDLPRLDSYCKQKDLPLKISVLFGPKFFALSSWDGDPNCLVSKEDLIGFEYYYDLIGSQPVHNTSIDAKNYIESFSAVRNPLSNYDLKLAKALKIIENG